MRKQAIVLAGILLLLIVGPSTEAFAASIDGCQYANAPHYPSGWTGGSTTYITGHTDVTCAYSIPSQQSHRMCLERSGLAGYVTVGCTTWRPVYGGQANHIYGRACKKGIYNWHSTSNYVWLDGSRTLDSEATTNVNCSIDRSFTEVSGY